jgi:hypothetical protein
MPRTYCYVCFDCKKSVTRNSWLIPKPICSDCHEKMKIISDKVPPKQDKKGWKKLQEKYRDLKDNSANNHYYWTMEERKNCAPKEIGGKGNKNG